MANRSPEIFGCAAAGGLGNLPIFGIRAVPAARFVSVVLFSRFGLRFRSSRLRLLAVLALLLGASGAAVAATLLSFGATYDGASVRVEWEVNAETDVMGFDLARKAGTETSFSPVTSVVPNGQRRYQFVDTNVYRTASGALSGPFTYRLTVRCAGGDQTYTATLAGTPSAVQRSWGTIKSMFR